MPRLTADLEYLQRKALRKKILVEHDRVLTEIVIHAGGWITPERLVVLPNRPKGWRPDEWPTFAIVSAACADNGVRMGHTYRLDNEMRAKARAFIESLMPERSHEPGGVLVLCCVQ